jgi:hypothetical protein
MATIITGFLDVLLEMGCCCAARSLARADAKN